MLAISQVTVANAARSKEYPRKEPRAWNQVRSRQPRRRFALLAMCRALSARVVVDGWRSICALSAAVNTALAGAPAVIGEQRRLDR